MKKQHTKSYDKLLKQVQTELTPTQKVMGKFIHNRVIWKTLQLVEVTLFRSTPLTVAYVVSFIAGLYMLAVASTFGYHIQSFSILLFVFISGYIIGIIIEYFKLLLKR